MRVETLLGPGIQLPLGGIQRLGLWHFHHRLQITVVAVEAQIAVLVQISREQPLSDRQLLADRLVSTSRLRIGRTAEHGLTHSILHRGLASSRRAVDGSYGSGRQRASSRVQPHLLRRSACNVDRTADRRSCQRAFHCSTRHALHQWLLLGPVLQHLLLNGLRQLFQHALGQRAASNATSQPGRFACHLADTASQRALHVDQASTLCKARTKATQGSTSHTSTSRRQGGAPRVDLAINLIHGAAGDHSTLTTSTGRDSLPRGLASGRRAGDQPSSAPTYQRTTADSATRQHLRQRLSHQACNIARIARVGTRDIQRIALFPGLLNLSSTLLALWAVFLLSLFLPLAGLEASRLTDLVSRLVDNTAASERADTHISQTSDHTGQLLHAAF
ncbi:hypothetical protein [Ectopseudomonas oleovorans]|uniref:Uncharacterized protein n=1 Tax=Ectopseudomonas oleovorans TaxID=301 RepID=A0AA42TW21_ECTOL|nr:hypothetical protein [Pseudomonas oleovorans]MDH1341852.1 hypothetical protein [Pseudomonas oleovorans]MDH1490920.1 hypothetical protein [Pseudomonas oleovorans]WGG19577.1 hypothetical protein N5O83_13960 [Pseudomonas oleovorans]